jgi:hypothetical protein
MILSGKPMPEAPFEIWSQYEFCYPRRNPLGQTYYTFLNRWFIKAGHDWALRLDRRDEFYQVVGRHCLEFDLRDLEEWRKVVGVNDARYLIETYEESSEQRNLLDYMYENWALPRTLEILDTEDEYDDCDQGVIGDVGDIEFNYTMSLQSKARQIASGFYYTPEGDVVELRHNPKLALLGGLVEDLIREKPNRAIVVWQLYKAERPQLLDLFERIGVHAVLGPSPEALAQFATKAAQAIIMPATSTQGFNELVRADTNIFYSSPYSTELREQAESRLVRIGQTSEVVNHIDLCSPRLIDRDIITALQTKSLSTARLKAIFNKYASKPRLKETAR